MTVVSERVTRSAVTSVDGTRIGYQTVGDGDGLILVGGALRSGDDYVALARALADRFAVHLVDRRGRGASGPQGPGYCLERECDDLVAVQEATGATAVFGHSYGGLVALETARSTSLFSHVVAYEPGVSVGGSVPVAWLPRYRRLLAAGDRRGAFAVFVRGSGGAPGPVATLPLWYLRAVLRAVMRKDRWRRVQPLLEASAAEHEEVARSDDGSVERYRSIAANVLLLGGAKSGPNFTVDLFEHLQRVVPHTTVEVLPGLDHFAPDDKAPEIVAERVQVFIS